MLKSSKWKNQEQACSCFLLLSIMVYLPVVSAKFARSVPWLPWLPWLPWPRTQLLAAQLIFPRWSTSRILAEMSILHQLWFIPYGFNHPLDGAIWCRILQPSTVFPWNISHDKFLFSNGGPTKFPAQVRSSIYCQCLRLMQSAWKLTVINYVAKPFYDVDPVKRILWLRIHWKSKIYDFYSSYFRGFAWLCSQQSIPQFCMESRSWK